MEKPLPSIPATHTRDAASSPFRRAVRGLHAETRRRVSPTGALPLPPPSAAPIAGADGSDPLVRELAQLRAAVTRHVCGLRAQGMSPEQMLVQVKALVREGMAGEGWHDLSAVQLLTSHVVAWSIAAYYDR